MKQEIIVEGPYNFLHALKRLSMDPLQNINLEKKIFLYRCGLMTGGSPSD
ncbi:hypothetical protein [Alkalicoccus halolimnae]|uniref:Uncharacterized protein n=1 Tax=Alkalicoccus halolimnae TaxID=1667239 RepID=A0AAJ8LZ23_9BACI|nr:hypothetical protein [Alkalicoccus halolimnae]